MTRAHRLAAVVVVAFLLASPALAEQASTQATPPSPESLGVSLKQIRQQLNDVPALPPAPRTGLRYDFFVNVFGTRPAINFFKDFDLSMEGPVKWGGVTHQEILNAVTPFPFQHYGSGVDMLSLIRKQQ
jgi:hypothetical protein